MCALWGGICLGAGTLAYALFSPSTVGCSTNVVVLTRSAVTARGCAAYSVLARIGVGLMVLGAVLLLGSFLVAVRSRRRPTQMHQSSEVAESVGSGSAAPLTAAGAGTRVVASTESEQVAPVALTPPTPPTPLTPPTPPTPLLPPAGPAPADGSVAQVSVGSGGRESEPHRPLNTTFDLPPGWYGNPNAPGRPVQWWDGTKLVDRPGQSDQD